MGDVAAVRLVASRSRERLRGRPLALESLAAAATRDATIDGWWIDDVWDFIRHLVAMLAADIPRRRGACDAAERRRSGAIGRRAHTRVFVERGAVDRADVVLRHDRRPDPRARGRTCAHSRGSSVRCYVGERQHRHRRPHRALRRSATVQGARRGEHTIFLGHANKGARRIRRPLVVGPVGQPRRGHDHEQSEEHYGPVALWTPDGMRDTGMQFLGTLFGDHAKTGDRHAAHDRRRARRRRQRVRQRDAAEGGGAVLVGRQRSTRRRTTSRSFSKSPSA